LFRFRSSHSLKLLPVYHLEKIALHIVRDVYVNIFILSNKAASRNVAIDIFCEMFHFPNKYAQNTCESVGAFAVPGIRVYIRPITFYY